MVYKFLKQLKIFFFQVQGDRKIFIIYKWIILETVNKLIIVFRFINKYYDSKSLQLNLNFRDAKDFWLKSVYCLRLFLVETNSHALRKNVYH